MARSNASSKQIVFLALAGDLLVVCAKAVAALSTGSSAMLSEAVHSLVDSANEGLLLYAYKRANRRPDLIHPLGYGRELYFWSFIVALMLFGLGAGVSLYQGVQHILTPVLNFNPIVNYVVLACSFVFEGVSWCSAFRRLRATRGGLGYWEAIHRSKDPPSFMVLLEDSAALAGVVIAALGIYLSHKLTLPWLDGLASVFIAVLLALVAMILARETKSLLIGERASPAMISGAVDVARRTPGVVSANGAITVQLAPNQILAALSIEFDDHLNAVEIESCVALIEARVRENYPDICTLFIKPQSRGTFERWRENRFGLAEDQGVQLSQSDDAARQRI